MGIYYIVFVFVTLYYILATLDHPNFIISFNIVDFLCFHPSPASFWAHFWPFKCPRATSLFGKGICFIAFVSYQLVVFIFVKLGDSYCINPYSPPLVSPLPTRAYCTPYGNKQIFAHKSRKIVSNKKISCFPIILDRNRQEKIKMVKKAKFGF